MVLELNALIANTTFGHVFRCTDTTTGVEYAVKQYTQECYEVSAELQVSKALMQQAPHPHLVQLVGQYERNCCKHLVFEYCAQGDLYELLTDKPMLPRNQSLMYFRQIVSGVHHLHKIGYAHRDISLENILVDANGDCKLCDFGLAASTSELSDATVGKVFYMAPEVFAGEEYNPAAADVWSLGILFFILMTGVPMLNTPSDDDGGYRIVARQGVKALIKLWNMENQFTKTQLQLLDRMLQVNPKKRIKMHQLHAKIQPKVSWRSKWAQWF
ncbi:kinase [Thraustotheca clavata]|uniref:Kinase n=1 Tax=Thraustotheca clavata TaxID=74557 RepID=A0A1W0A9Y6_9STRA|nr:kinase [Thraustotheca clavata]